MPQAGGATHVAECRYRSPLKMPTHRVEIRNLVLQMDDDVPRLRRLQIRSRVVRRFAVRKRKSDLFAVPWESEGSARLLLVSEVGFPAQQVSPKRSRCIVEVSDLHLDGKTR
jgi:hypothetical protein